MCIFVPKPNGTMIILDVTTYNEQGEPQHELIGPFDDHSEAEDFVRMEGVDTHESQIEYRPVTDPMDYK